jgi:WD40 repeat protein
VALGQPLADSSGGLTSVTFHPSGRYLATGSTSGAVSLWTLPTGLIPNRFGRIDSPAFSTDGTVMVTASDNVAQLWTGAGHLTRAATLRLPGSPEGGFGYTVRVDPTGRILATASLSVPTMLWDISDTTKPMELGTLPNTTKYAGIVAFSPDGRTVATASDDSTVQLWDITEPARPQRLSEPLTGYAGYLIAVTFSPDGRTVVASSADRTVRAWDITDRARPVAIGDSLIPPGAASRTRVAFDPQGRLYAASRDGTIRIFNLDTDNTQRICASTRNVLTEQRWNQILAALPYNPPCR